MIRIVIADDHALVRTGLAQLLTAVDDFEIVGEASDGQEAIDLALALAPDVVLMDVSMPDVGGIEATRRLLQKEPSLRVVMLTAFHDRERVLEAIDAGAVGYLLKDAEPDDLVRGVHAAARGESPLDPRAASEVLGARTRARPAADLTAREREVLELLADGLANKQIARKLGISEKTVKTHLTSVFQRIGVTDRTQAALWAQRNRIN
jgi:DNA-binding NarL/FixJ family response regulator